MIMGLALSLTASVMLAGKGKMREHGKLVETELGARSVVNAVLRELRLSGACLPPNGEFIALEAIDNASTDEITTRSGLTSLGTVTCIRAAAPALTLAGSTTMTLDDVTGFSAGMQVYIRGTAGSGMYANLKAVDAANNQITFDTPLDMDYGPASGVYPVETRRFFIEVQANGVPDLMLQINDSPPISYAAGIEALELSYELANGSLVDLPLTPSEWRHLRMINVTSTSRSLLPNEISSHYRRSYSLGIKPRNLLN